MKPIKSTFILIAAAASLISCGGQNKKNISIKDKEEMTEKFDFKAYEERTKNDPFYGDVYVKDDGTIVEEIAGDRPVRWEIPPPPSFIKVYKEFYKNGDLSVQKSVMGEHLEVGISVYYDEKGQKSEVNEDAKFGKIKPDDILKFLADKKRINLQTAEGVFDLENNFTFKMVYNEEKNTWHVIIDKGRPYTAVEMSKIMETGRGEPNDWKSFEYVINGETGEVISSDE
jgi:hypothetical protein